MPRYEFKEGKSSKFWQIELEEDSFTTRWGRIGTDGQEATKSFDSRAEAKREYDKLIAEKVKKGYQLVSAGGGDAPPAAQQSPELEAKIAESPDNVQAFQVYADWLQGQGDPRGELIAVQIALAAGPNPELTAQEQRLLEGATEEYFYGDGADHIGEAVGVTWRYGFFDTLRVSLDYDAASEVDFDALLTALLKHPSARFLRGLTVGMFDYEGENHYPRVTKILHKVGPIPTLRSLHLGDFEYPDETEISWANVGDVSKLWALYPGLEELILQGAEIGLGKIVAPKLRSLTLRTGGLPTAALESLAAAKLPSLERLEVWTGDDNYGGESTFDDVAPLLTGESFPKLTHLGIANCAYAGQVLAALVTAKLTPRLGSLDLSKGTLVDDELAPLFDHPDLFRRLSRIDLSDCLLSPAACAKLEAWAAGGPKLSLADQRADDGDDDRYVAVGE